jgi:hypothetical protein
MVVIFSQLSGSGHCFIFFILNLLLNNKASPKALARSKAQKMPHEADS